jgi:hypothetical protein
MHSFPPASDGGLRREQRSMATFARGAAAVIRGHAHVEVENYAPEYRGGTLAGRRPVPQDGE